MRTAKEIIKETSGFIDLVFAKKYRDKGTVSIDEAIKMINTARKEAIEECAELAKSNVNTNGEWTSYNVDSSVDKNSILSLINELQ